MTKVFLMLMAFIKELIISKEEELNITSTKFSFRKAIQFLIIACSFLLNYFLLNRIVYISNKYIAVIEENKKLTEYKADKNREDKIVGYLENNDQVCIKLAKKLKERASECKK